MMSSIFVEILVKNVCLFKKFLMIYSNKISVIIPTTGKMSSWMQAFHRFFKMYRYYDIPPTHAFKPFLKLVEKKSTIYERLLE